MSLIVEVPTSKSITQRALFIAALAPSPTLILQPLDCDDSRHLRAALTALGTQIEWTAEQARVVPSSALTAQGRTVSCGNAGTAVRFGSCLSLISDGALVVDGDAHMRKRPIGPLGDSLAAMGVRVRYLGAQGCPPIELSRLAAAPRQVSVDTSLSSQYASGLLMVAPRLEQGLELELSGQLVSLPYLRMTVAMMQKAGAEVSWPTERSIVVSPGGYGGGSEARRINVEPDWSAAAFILAAGRILDRPILPAGLASTESASESLQGDAVIANMLEQIDRADRNDFDLTDAPDLIAPLTAACLFAQRPTRIRGAAHTRIKECDRVQVLCRGLRLLGADAHEHVDGLDLEPLRTLPSTSVRLDPESDHRMAMAFGIISLRIPSLEVTEPDCVSKSFPDFWQVLGTIRDATA